MEGSNDELVQGGNWGEQTHGLRNVEAMRPPFADDGTDVGVEVGRLFLVPFKDPEGFLSLLDTFHQ